MCNINVLINGLIQSVRDAFNGQNIENMAYREMTDNLFAQLDNLGNQLGVDVRRTVPNQNWEFLYDVCFLVTCGINPHGYFAPQTPLRKALLVLECEWNSNNNDNDTLYDFTKLLMARSELRTLVFDRNSNNGFKSIKQDVQLAIAAFEQGAEADRYLICGLVANALLRFVLLDGNGNELFSYRYPI
ncbi:MAG: hypothetical protein OXN20_17585 [Gemmatimonadota bacterium]|nr:hypothetical protein [Gemmatimonadota bacterium]